VGQTGPQGFQGFFGAQGFFGKTGLTGPQGFQGIYGPQGSFGLTGLLGPQGLDGILGAQGALGLSGVIGSQGSRGPQGSTGLPKYAFSVLLNSFSITGGVNNTQLTGFTVAASPYYNDGSLNTTTGNFTVPETGKYSFRIDINYNAPTLTVSLGGSIFPSFILRRSPSTTTGLIVAALPVLDVAVVLLLTLRAVIGNGSVTLVGDLQLNAGDVIQLAFVSSGLSLGLQLGSSIQPGVVWSTTSLF